MKKIVFIIAVLNEESRITDTINSISEFAEEIILADAGSTDNTIMLAEAVFPVKVVQVPHDMFNVRGRIQKIINEQPFVMSGRWLFPMNCSERFTMELGNHILRKINNPLYRNNFAYSVYRQSKTFGANTHNRKLLYIFKSILRSSQPRLFMMSAIDLDKSRMHFEFPVFEHCKSGLSFIFPIENRMLLHIRDGELKYFEQKHSHYSDNESKELYGKGKKANVWMFLKTVIFPCVYFLPLMLLSKEQFIVMNYHIFYKFQVWSKLYFLCKQKKS